MSKRSADLESRLREAERKLQDAEREVAQVSGANGRLSAQLDERDITIRTLVESNATLTASLSARSEDQDAGFPG